MKARIFIVILAGIACLTLGSGEYKKLGSGDPGGVEHATLSVNDSGDTAQVTTRMPVLALDSFKYIDSFSYQADTTAHKTINWTSPLQVARITPTLDTSTVYSCSVAFAAETLGFDCNPDETVASLAALIDTLVYLFNNTTNLKDSVVAQDSATYLKLVSKFSEKTFTQKWVVQIGVTGGTGTLDTAGVVTDKAMVCDSMAAAINASANLDSFLTAAVTAAETTFTITSDKKGLLFWDSSLCHPDTYSVVTRTQANVTSTVSVTDSAFIGDVEGFKTLQGWIILNPGRAVNDGVGDSDSGYIWLYATNMVDQILIGQDTCNALPCSLNMQVHSAVGDTLLRDRLLLKWRLWDTCSDTTEVVQYPFRYDLKLY